jgi:hypothetical protein
MRDDAQFKEKENMFAEAEAFILLASSFLDQLIGFRPGPDGGSLWQMAAGARSLFQVQVLGSTRDYIQTPSTTSGLSNSPTPSCQLSRNACPALPPSHLLA